MGVPTLAHDPGPPPFDYLARAQIVGMSELPGFLRLASPRTASAWQQRKKLPPPDYPSVNGSPAWRRLTIIRWAAATGKLPPWLEAEGAPFSNTNGRRRPRRADAHA